MKFAVRLLLIVCFVPSPLLGFEKSKYGSEAKPLTQDHEYILKHAAPDYWSLSPYYVGQQTDSACSVASITMLINAIRAKVGLHQSDKLMTQTALLKLVHDKDWEKAVSEHSPGVTLGMLKQLTEKSLRASGVNDFKVELHYVENETVKEEGEVHRMLTENEDSNETFVLANFIQGVLTEDAMIGHIAPVAAFDPDRKRVLILDPDREWYEPYWVSEKTFVKGMAVKDPVSKRPRGLLIIRLPKARPTAQFSPRSWLAHLQDPARSRASSLQPSKLGRLVQLPKAH